MTPPLTPLQQAFLALQNAEHRAAAAEAKLRAPVAIVGLACRAPGGVRDAESFWRLLDEGRDAVGPVPGGRWDHDALYDPAAGAPGKISTRSGGFLTDVDQFDPEFFGISSREADGMDPQQRMVLEVCWEALENAGQAPDRLQHTATGVYIGAAGSDYAYLQLRGSQQDLDAHFASGVAHSVLSGRVSYLLGLQGPSLTVDTACSSSLVAVHLACQALRSGECRLALAGGVNLILSPDAYVALSQARMLAPDGRCKTFAAGADGFGRGEGCAMVALKLLADAEADGDRVLAVIRGSAINQDGPSSGLTTPNGPAQEAVIRAALAQAQVEPRQIGYVEAHGTGTELGDPLEARALSAALCGPRAAPLLIGSAKSNLGHLEGAAGAIGLIKLVLSLQHGVIPRSLHCATPSPHIAWNDLALRVVADAAIPWPSIDDRRIGGVSSFGFSGTNAHLVVEAAPAAAREPDGGRAQLLPISAHTEDALPVLAASMRDAQTPDLRLADVARTLGVGRAHREHRAVVVSDSISSFRDSLDAIAHDRDDVHVRIAATPRRDPPRLAFLFTGQGAQYPGMAARLHATAPAFRAAFDRCDAILAPLLGASLGDTVLNSRDAEALSQTGLAQPALFVVEYALAEMLRSMGVTPVAVMGHSIGEIVAACVAGAIDLPDALRLVAARGALLQALPTGGAMAAVFAPEALVAKAVAPHAASVSIAALNGPTQTVISGAAETVSRICAELAAAGIKTQPLKVSHAFHSPLVEPAMAAFEREVVGVSFTAPQIALFSNVTGKRLSVSELSSPGYWSRHLREPVRFADGLASVAALKIDICLELGPHPALTAFAGDVFAEGGPRVLPTLRRGTDDWRSILDTIGELFLAGVAIDWQGLDPDRAGRPISLPSSTFMRRRHWFRNKAPRAATKYEHKLLGRRVRTAIRDVVLFEAEIDAEDVDFISDHVVRGRVIMPAAGMIEMAISAGKRTGGADTAAIQSMMIAAPLAFEREPRLVQTLVRKDGARPASFEILSSAADAAEPDWILHAQGEYAPAGAELIEARAPLSGGREISATKHYEMLADRGLTFGGSLKLVQRIYAAAGVADGEIAPTAPATLAGYEVRPEQLDAWIQVMAATAPEGSDKAYLPISIDRIAFVRPPSGATRSSVALRQSQTSLLRADILVSDAAGVVMEIKGIALRPAHADAASDLYQVEWRKAPEAADDAAWAPSPAELEAALGSRLQVLARAQRHELDEYQMSFLALERASVQWILQMFATLGWRPRAGDRATAVDLSAELGITPRYQRLLRRYLDILSEEGVLSREGEAYRVVSWQAEAKIAASGSREARTMITTACAEHLASIVTEREDPLNRLFPNGSSALAERLYRETPEALVFNTLLAETVARAVDQAPAGRKVRILEVGAGTGGSTAYVAPVLKDANVAYTFTDIGAAFVNRAQQSFAAYPFMSFQRFDLEASPAAQGLANESFDVIIAANCVHATADLKETLARLRDLLAPGGLLLMLEVTGLERWIDLTFGLTEGWWRFTDLDVRPHYPLLDSPQWTKLLEKLGFAASAIGERLPTSRETLIAARKPVAARPRKVALVGGAETLRRELAGALARHGHASSFGEEADLSADIVIYLGMLAADKGEPLEAIRTAFEPLLAVVRGLGSRSGAGRLALVTRGAAAVDDVSPIQAAALGFVRTAAAELGELRPAIIDLDPSKSVSAQMDALVSALFAGGSEQECALRDGVVLASRLVRLGDKEAPSVRLKAGASGVLDDLSLVPAPRNAPGRGQVEIRVAASSLNFRDLMNALAMRSDADPLGGECAGVVSAVGEGVEEFAVGDAVVSATSGTFATYALSEIDAVVKRPPGWTDGQASALPLVAMTAQHALVDVARLQPGQTVLIHAGAGGVGMVAMQISKRCGARIFATAGTEEKRALLRELGAEHAFSSRTLEFEQQILAATDGRGVDVVLNSLAGPFIEASVRCLASNGMFLEIGKSEIWSEAQFHALRPAGRYAPLDLATMFANDHSAFTRLFQIIMADAKSGALAPLPVRAFPLARAKDAFSFMAHARHIGKIVLTQDAQAGGAFEPDGDGQYLITGGYGGLGFATAERLFERGARGFALLGRTSPTAVVKAKLDAWRSQGAEILELTGDISQPSTVSTVFARIDESRRPLRGVVHSAGELSEGAMLQQDWAQFEPPLRAKVRGAWLLHQHTKDRRLDFFAVYSSIASIFGAAGQANHAAANAFLDALASYRRERGLPATSIAWGAWSQVGAAAASGADARASASGVGVISPARGLEILESLLAGGPAHVVVSPMDWRAYLERWVGKPPAFYADVAPTGAGRATSPRSSGDARRDSDMLRRLQDLAPGGRRDLLTTFVGDTAQRVLGAVGDIDRKRPLNELGLDSLLAVELRNRLGTALALSPGLPATVVFDCPTVDLLAEHLMTRLWPSAPSDAPAAVAVRGSESVVEGVDNMSDEEIDAMFDRAAGT